MEYIYFHQYAIKFKINKELSKKDKQFLKSPLYQLQTENSGIITSSINILSDSNTLISELHNPFIGERIIPLEEFQKRVQKSELIYIWNSLTQYFKDHIIRYSFDFTVNYINYGFVGEKVNILPWNILTSHTTCFGRLVEKDTGKLISTSVTFFKLSKMLSFLSSIRLK